MKIIDKKIFSGRNIYSHKPVMKVIVDLEELTDKDTTEFAGFNDRLISLFPNLIDHHCGIGEHGGFVKRLKEGTYFAHVVEHIVLELQAILGYKVFFGKTRLKKSPSIYTMIIEYDNEDVAVECVKEAVYIVENTTRNIYVDLEEILNYLGRIKERYELGPSSRSIFDEAKRRRIPIRRIGDNSILELGYGKYSRLVQAALTDTTSAIAIDISCDKQLTKQILKENNIPVTCGDIASNIDKALDIANDIGYPVVLKPLDGNQGVGVVLNINSPEELEENFNIPKKHSNDILVEKYIEGKDYRVLVVGDKVCAVAERKAPEVIGDGIHTIEELVKMENKNELRGEGHEKPQTKITLDRVARNHLKKEYLTERSIPKKGQVVSLRENKNISTGGSATECTESIHPYNAQIAINAAKIIGLDIAGIDIMARDISKPITECEGAIIEVNAVPGLRMHLYPTEGKSINVATDILDFLYPKGKPYSIPIIATTGTNGKTTTTRLLNHILSRAGKKVGMTTSSGIYIDNKCVLEGDTTGPISAKDVLSSKEIDIALLEVARGGLVKRGLGYDLADIGILTNVSEDHIGLDGIEDIEDLAFVKSLVLEAIKPNGNSVINVDDKMADYFIKRSCGNLILFSKNRNNKLINEHIGNGKIALCVEDDSIYIYDKSEKIKLVNLKDIPITFNGLLECNVENVLAASSAIYGLGTSVSIISEGLKTFKSDANMNPGRFNIFELGSMKVMLDYGHNIEGYKEVGKFLNKLNVSRAVGIIGVPGDRTDQQIFEIGAKCAEIFSKVYIKEDKDLRGRKPSEVANILYKGLISANFDINNVKIITSEIEALKSAVLESKPEDFITLFYEEFELAKDLIVKMQEKELDKVNVVLSSLA